MQKKQRFVADQRYDLPQYNSMLGFIDAEFNAYNLAFFSPENRILGGWNIENNGGLQVKVTQVRDSFLFNSERVGYEGILYRKLIEDALTLDLADNTINYVELQIVEETCAPDTVAIWDTTANAGEGEEFTQTVDTVTAQAPLLVSNTIAFTGDPDKLPLAVVTTAGGVITDIADARQILFELEAPYDFGINRTDRNIDSIKKMYDALATAILEMKGTLNWYDVPYAGVKLLKEYQNMFVTGGGSIRFEGVAGANTVQWTSDLTIEIAGRSDTYLISAASAVLLDGQALYVDIPEGTPGGPLAPIVVNIEDVPLNPSDVGYSAGIQVLFFRRGGTVYGYMDIPELDSGETAVIGIDLPSDIRTKLGILDEATFEAYSAAALALGIIDAADSLPTAISKLATNPPTIKVDYIDISTSVLPSGTSFSPDGVAVVDGDRVLFTNSALNRIYEVSGVGVSLVWTALPVFGGSETPSNGDWISVEKGATDYFKTHWRYRDNTVGWRPMEPADLESEPTGFQTRDQATLSFDEGTRTFTITPVGAYFDYATLGRVYRKTTPQSIVIPDTEGQHFIYFDGPTLTTATVFTYDILKKYAFVSEIYWDQANQKAVVLAEERHGLTLDGATHRYLHSTIGTRWVSGLSAGNFDDAGDGSSDTHAQLSISNGLMFDEDIDITPTDYSGVVDEFNTVETSQINGDNSGSLIGFSRIVPTDISLSQVRMRLRRNNGAMTGNISVSVYQMVGTNVLGSLLGTSALVDVTTISVTPTFTEILFTFSTPIELANGTNYGFILNTAGISTSSIGFAIITVATVSGLGTLTSFDNGSSWTFNNSWEPMYGLIAAADAFEQVLDPIAEIPVLYRDGASGNWRKLDATQFPVENTGSGRLAFNNPAGPWTIDEVTNQNFVAMWIFGTNDIRHPIIAIMGQREDTSLNDAQANNTYESLSFGVLPSLEMKVLYRLIFQTDDTFANSVKAALKDVRDLRQAIDVSLPAFSASDHGNLTGLTDPDHPATAITADTSGFDGGLSDQDDLVQYGLDTLNKRLGQLRIVQAANPSRVAITGADRILNSGITIGQELRNLLLKFDGAQIDFNTGEVFESDGVTPLNGGAHDFTPAVIPANEYHWYSIQLIPGSANANNTINGGVLVIAGSASNVALANAPRAAFGNNVVKLGEVWVQESGGNIDTITNANITQLGIGSGSGGSGIDEAALFLEDLKAFLRNEETPEFLTPNVIPLDADTKIDVSSTGEYDVANNVYKFTENPTDVLSNAGLGTLVLNLAPSGKAAQTFTAPADLIMTGFKVRLSRDPSVTTGNLIYRIQGTTAGAPDDSNIIQSGTIPYSDLTVSAVAPPIFTKTIPNLPIQNGVTYAVVIENQMDGDLWSDIDVTAGFAGGSAFAFGGSWADQGVDYRDFAVTAFVAEFLLTEQSYGARFLSEDRDNVRIYLHALWAEGAIDDAATYEVSIDGGATFETVTMSRIGSSGKFTGLIEVGQPTLATIAEYPLIDADTTRTFNGGAIQGYAIKLPMIAAGTKQKSIQATLVFNKVGAAIGDIIYQVVRDNGGVPTGDIITEERTNIANMSVGNNNVVVSIPTILLDSDDLWLVAKPSTAYAYSAAVTEVGIRVDTTVLTYSEGDSYVYNGTNWAADAGRQAVFKLEGFEFDLRAKITSSQSSSLVGLGLFYGENNLKSVEAASRYQRFDINGDDNVTEITVTNFIPNPTTCVVWDTNTGQGLRFPAIEFDGRKIKFADEQFLSPGETIPLIVDNGEGIIDNSDINAALLAMNKFGSTDPTFDRSVAGEGPLTRADNGKLVEYSLHWNGVAYEWVFAEVN